MSNDDFLPCTKCGKNWLDDPSPMFHNHIWAAMGMEPQDLLCDNCALSSIVTDCPWNKMIAAKKLLGLRSGELEFDGGEQTKRT